MTVYNNWLYNVYKTMSRRKQISMHVISMYIHIYYFRYTYTTSYLLLCSPMSYNCGQKIIHIRSRLESKTNCNTNPGVVNLFVKRYYYRYNTFYNNHVVRGAIDLYYYFRVLISILLLYMPAAIHDYDINIVAV